MSEEERDGSAARRLAERKSGKDAWRVPGWVVPIVAAGSGWLFAGWPGALFGAVVGTFIWRSR
jgi:hypothetical protein